LVVAILDMDMGPKILKDPKELQKWLPAGAGELHTDS
jgi:hypothetical protein